MESIKIRRFTGDPHGRQGSIEPESGKWQLVLDEDGGPHLFVRVWMADDKGAKVEGWLCIDDLLDEDLEPAGMIDGEFGGELTPEEAEEAHKELMERRGARAHTRCPA